MEHEQVQGGFGDLIRCPKDNQKLKEDSKRHTLVCEYCGEVYQVQNSVPILFRENSAKDLDIRQKQFYEGVYGKKGLGMEERASISPVSETAINRTWRRIRDFYATSQSVREAFSFFKSQFKFDGGERALEIGCGAGTPGTDECVQKCGEIDYVGIDFAFTQLPWLKNRFESEGAHHFKVVNGDILDNCLKHEFFDIVFGRGILHHFDREAKSKLAIRIRELLKPGGRAFFLEPMNTNPIMKLFRSLSRPFRPNLIWEHPFSSREIDEFVSFFDCHEIHRYEGLTMLSLPLAFSTTLFEVTNRVLIPLDRYLVRYQLFSLLYTKSVIVVHKR